jgi:uncharacterized protein YndB with AHSA1/START domain
VIEPLRVNLFVDCPPDHAFRTWTERATAWWPPAHTVSHERGASIVFEPRVGGRIYECTAAGQEIEWGVVTAWEPPHRLAYRWHIATTPSDATDVEIRFRGTGSGATEVAIEHRGWEQLGVEGGRWRDVNQGGWDGVLPDYAEACRARAL